MSPASKKTPFWRTFCSFFAPFLETPKKHRKIDINASGGRFWRPNDPKVLPGAPQKEAKIHENHPEIVSEPPWARNGCKRYPPSTKVLKTHPNALEKDIKSGIF